MLAPLLTSGLNIVFVGTEPGPDSLRLGQYYANPRNAFYNHLAEAGLTPSMLRPAEFHTLLEYGIGLDDVYGEPNELCRRIEAAAPRAVCFNSSEALRRFAGASQITPPWRRENAVRYARLGVALVWATSDSSWNASKYWPSRLADLEALRARLLES
jgi:hypothetical protein